MMELDIRSPTNTAVCLLCRGFISYISRDRSHYYKHLENDHSVTFSQDYIMAINFFDKDIRQKIVDQFNSSPETRKQESTGKEEKLEMVIKKEAHEEALLKEGEKNNDSFTAEETKESSSGVVENKVSDNCDSTRGGNIDHFGEEGGVLWNCDKCRYALKVVAKWKKHAIIHCLLYTSPSPRDS